MQQGQLFSDNPDWQHVSVAGVDEAGRGPLAGPVVAAAVVLPADHGIHGLNDSKVLTAARRDALAVQIRARALAFSIVFVEVEEIDRINILQATMVGMQRAVEALQVPPDQVLIDGNRCPAMPMPAQAIVGGDGKVAAISAASILAKTSRDAYMVTLAQRYPGYGFEQHKGYGTAQHMAALASLGATPEHRRSFAPVARVLEGERA